MSNRTITAVFDNETDALRAQEALAAHGIARSDIQMHRQAGTAADTTADKGFWESLADLFMPEADRHTYAEAVGRGATVMSVRLSGMNWEEAADILEANGAVDLDEREASWRAEGWSGQSSYARSDYMSGQPDGAPGNPPGTMLSRGTDEVLGTNISGAYPENEAAANSAYAADQGLRGRDTATGTAARATGVSGVGSRDSATTGDTARDVDSTLGTNFEGRPDGTPGNPPGTMLSRGADDALGTNMSGARPEHETGGRSGGMASGATEGTLGGGMGTGRDTLHDGESIPLAEERLRVSKRETGHGRVRIRSYVVEEPVEAQVTLRDEHVEVERRTLDRPASGMENPFQERTIEATESHEEAEIAKEARVTGEVRLRKEAEERTETVRDTVRRTEVEVERDGDTPKRRT
ncbi:YsnF/AvaK domain-containing protein [Sabulicella glaciei]|uniref:DUF2382 domain-containing protein n=1 Tax=Sabulicella glaciei TaxID=2984948 RepID=A0ABT3NST7_9PROT|nr:DUF2382 domain-containing protein [Roseococcus sp. MDT2-1-1]MCW8085221.1 DUF2382 domain-containing protein [Roseococcus sp. MDT2-1-1]